MNMPVLLKIFIIVLCDYDIENILGLFISFYYVFISVNKLRTFF